MVTTVESSWLSFPAYLSPGSGPGLGQPQAPSPSPPPPAPPAPLAALDQINAVRNGTQQMNGMNLGGWLVIEQFLAPEMYANASTTVPWGPNPLTFGVYGERQLGIDAAQQDANDTTGTLNVTGRWRQAMFDHRATFITESDFATLAAAGINTVRIPVGFWLFAQTAVRRLHPSTYGQHVHGQTIITAATAAQAMPHLHLTPGGAPMPYEVATAARHDSTPRPAAVHFHRLARRPAQTDMPPFVEGAYLYMDLAMQWAAKYGLAVNIGVHSVNGSQNGYEASAPEIARTELWDATPYTSPTYYNQSLTFVSQLMQRYGSSPALVAVSLMNEPTVSVSVLVAGHPCMCGWGRFIQPIALCRL
jgi:hypothetical protein